MVRWAEDRRVSISTFAVILLLGEKILFIKENIIRLMDLDHCNHVGISKSIMGFIEIKKFMYFLLFEKIRRFHKIRRMFRSTSMQ